MYAAGGRARHHRHGPHLGVRLRARVRHSGQGAHPHAAVGLLVRPPARHRPEPRDHARPLAVPAGGTRLRRPVARAQHARPAHDAGANRMRRAWLPGRVRVERVRADGRRLRHSAAARTAGVRSAARADLHAGDEGGVGPRREHFRRHGRLADRRRGRVVPRTRHAGPLRPRLHARRVARHHPRRHQVRVRVDRPTWRQRPDVDRRGRHARLLPVLAEG